MATSSPSSVQRKSARANRLRKTRSATTPMKRFRRSRRRSGGRGSVCHRRRDELSRKATLESRSRKQVNASLAVPHLAAADGLGEPSPCTPSAPHPERTPPLKLSPFRHAIFQVATSVVLTDKVHHLVGDEPEFFRNRLLFEHRT